jgi:uncharacterized delta-60 repeat protein
MLMQVRSRVRSGHTGRMRARATIAAMIAAITLFSAQAAFAAAGDLDTTFSHDGRVLLHEAAVGVQVQSDGKVLVVDLTGAVRRLTPTGLLDRTYGGGTGVAQTGIRAVKAVIQRNGALLVLGFVDGTVPQVALVRLTSDGSLDATFNGDGRLVRTSLPAVDPSDVALGPSGRIFVAGTISFADPRIAVVAYTSGGRPLKTFGGDGFVSRGYHGKPASAHAIDVQTDGRVVVAGWFFQEPPEYDAGNRAMGVMRLTSTGDLDRSFGRGGTTVITFPYRVGGSAVSVLVRPANGDVYVGGTEITHSELVPTVSLARLNADGAIEMAVADGSPAQAQSMALQGGKVWLIGTYQVVDPPIWQLERYTMDGLMDVRVGEDFEGDSAQNASSATIWGGKLYVAGTVERQLGDVWFYGGVARYLVS